MRRRNSHSLISRSDDDVLDLLERLKTDRGDVKERDIAELEAEINDVVSELFDLTAEERAAMEDYLEVF